MPKKGIITNKIMATTPYQFADGPVGDLLSALGFPRDRANLVVGLAAGGAVYVGVNALYKAIGLRRRIRRRCAMPGPAKLTGHTDHHSTSPCTHKDYHNNKIRLWQCRVTRMNGGEGARASVAPGGWTFPKIIQIFMFLHQARLENGRTANHASD